MLKAVRKLALVAALALAFSPLAWERLLVPSADAQFQGFTQAAVLQNAVTGTAVGSNLDTSGAPIVTFVVSGTSLVNNAVTFQGSIDNVTWVNIGCYVPGTATVESIIGNNPGTLPALVRCNVVGIPLVRANITTSSAGTMTVKAYASQSYFGIGTTAP